MRGIAVVLMLMSGITHAVVYGLDNRKDVIDVDSQMKRVLAKSVAAMMPREVLKRNRLDSRYVDIKAESLRSSMNLCRNSKFGLQPTAGLCTGFLIAPDVLVTAGHCIETKNDCESMYWVFDYSADKTGSFQTRYTVAKSSIYKCAKIIKTRLTEHDNNDFAVIKLNRKVTDRDPLKVRRRGSIMYKNDVFVIGHPTGLPMKVADGAWVLQNFGGRGKYFSTNLDTFGGNSGSPVFNSHTYEVEGILVRGDTDYVDSTWNGKACTRPFDLRLDCPKNKDKCMGEHVTRITEIFKKY
jgi:V8-like Glu-specific endopeptidase